MQYIPLNDGKIIIAKCGGEKKHQLNNSVKTWKTFMYGLRVMKLKEK